MPHTDKEKGITKIIKYLCDLQVTEFGSLSRREYGGFYINDDDCPLAPYSFIESNTGIPLKELKSIVIEMRNDGLVELCVASNSDGRPNGSGWSITEKGLKYAVDNKIVEHENEDLILNKE